MAPLFERMFDLVARSNREIENLRLIEGLKFFRMFLFIENYVRADCEGRDSKMMQLKKKRILTFV